MKEIEIRFKVCVGDFPETRLTQDNIIRKVARMGEEILDDFDETVHDVEIYVDGEKEEFVIPNTI